MLDRVGSGRQVAYRANEGWTVRDLLIHLISVVGFTLLVAVVQRRSNLRQQNRQSG